MTLPVEPKSRKLATHVDRGVLVERIGKAAPAIIDKLVSASDAGDVRASQVLLNKILPDLKAVDVSQSGETFKLVIAPRVFMGKQPPGDRIELPNITVNIGAAEKAAPVPVIDVTPEPASPPSPDDPPKINYAKRRAAGVFE